MSSTLQLLKKHTIEDLFTIICLLAMWFFLPSSAFTHSVSFKPKVLPAFYQGGLQKGSGGKLERPEKY